MLIFGAEKKLINTYDFKQTMSKAIKLKSILSKVLKKHDVNLSQKQSLILLIVILSFICFLIFSFFIYCYLYYLHK